MLDFKTYYINTFFQYLQFVKQENIFLKRMPIGQTNK